jgi:hypothetical protein
MSMDVYKIPTFNHSELGSIVRLTQILLGVHERVSSQKPTSLRVERGLLDKLVIKLTTTQSVQSLRVRCRELNYKIEGYYKRDKRFYLSINLGHQIIDVLLGRPENTEFWQITINPSKFSHWSLLEMNLIQIFNPIVLTSIIYRLDFTYDIFEDYYQILSGLTVLNKSARTEFVDGSIRSGLQIGVGDDKFVIYDKGFKEKTDFSWTRIERQISGTKVFIKTLGEMKSSIEKILEFDPFSTVSLNNIHFQGASLSHGQRVKYDELRTLIKHEGFYLARKKLSKDRNFIRDYERFFQLIKYTNQPRDIFNRDIIKFFKETIQ